MLGLLCAGLVAAPYDSRISGIVTDGNRVVAGAVVRLQGTDISTQTGAQGEFTLDLAGRIVWPFARVTVWATGYYIAGPFVLQMGQRDVRLTLKRHHETDDQGYEWVAASSAAGNGGNSQNSHSHTGLPKP
jgi:hypothetical protein